jgi:hypothetical protein
MLRWLIATAILAALGWGTALVLWWRGGKEETPLAGAASPEDESVAIATLEKLRARYVRDEIRPGKPIVLVDCYDTKVTDGDFKKLTALNRLHTLKLRYTGVTDAGLKELAAFSQLETLDPSVRSYFRRKTKLAGTLVHMQERRRKSLCTKGMRPIIMLTRGSLPLMPRLLSGIDNGMSVQSTVVHETVARYPTLSLLVRY